MTRQDGNICPWLHSQDSWENQRDHAKSWIQLTYRKPWASTKIGQDRKVKSIERILGPPDPLFVPYSLANMYTMSMA